jgi:ABC-type multidrug transport system, ATPase and permease components
MNKTQKWLFTVPGKRKWYILILILLYAAGGGTGVLYALFMRNIVDCAVAADKAGFIRNGIFIGSLVLFQIALNALSRWLKELSRSEIENVFKKRLNDCILKKNYASVSAMHTAEWMNRLTSDTNIVARAYTEILPGLVGTIVRLVSALVMIIVLDAWFAYIVIPGGILMIFLTYCFRGKLKRLHKNIQEKNGKLRVFLQEHISSLMIIKSFSAEKQTSEQAYERMKDHKAARMKRNHFSNMTSTGMALAMQGMYLIGVIYCAYGILNGTVTYGTLTAIMQLISQVQAPFASISGYLPRYYAMIASAERLMEIEEFEDDMKGEAKTEDFVRDFYSEKLGSIRLENACFTYLPTNETDPNAPKANMPTVLENVSLDVKKGDYIAFTGHSGCGKSTVLKLLMCMYPLDSGERLLAERNGETEELGPEWRRLFAYVPQGNHLLSGTVRDIVSFAAPDQSGNDEKLRRALSIACADEFLGELENGVDTVLGERGTGLSEGQMQRIAIARAIFADNPVLLLDEATSALDEHTEKQLLSNLRSLTDKTVIIVTHRPAALSICDRVLRFTPEGIEEVK